MFVNPKPAGWTDGVDKITGQQIGTIATQLATAIDPVGGGSYGIAAGQLIQFVNGGGGWEFGCPVDFVLASTVTFRSILTPVGSMGRIGKREQTLTDGAGLTVDMAYDVYHFATPTAQRDVSVLSATGTIPSAFESIWLSRPATGAFPIIIHQLVNNPGAAIVTLPASTSCSAELIYHEDSGGTGRWRLGRFTTGAVAGADA